MAAILRSSQDADTALFDRVDRRIRAEMANNRKLQIRPGQERLDLGGDVYLSAPRLSEFAGAFLAGRYRPSTRIDFTQHCLSAMTKLERLGLEMPE